MLGGVDYGEDGRRPMPWNAALVYCARAAHDPIHVSTWHLTGVAEAHTAYGRDLILGGDSVSLIADGPGVNIWTWPRC